MRQLILQPDQEVEDFSNYFITEYKNQSESIVIGSWFRIFSTFGLGDILNISGIVFDCSFGSIFGTFGLTSDEGFSKASRLFDTVSIFASLFTVGCDSLEALFFGSLYTPSWQLIICFMVIVFASLPLRAEKVC